MKFFMTLLIGLLSMQRAQAASLGSIYNGEQYHLQGYRLVQDSDNPDKFFILPNRFRIGRFSEKDTEGKIKRHKSVSHRVESASDGRRYSVYTMTMELQEPSRKERQLATVALRRAHGDRAEIVGLAPVCGMGIDMPGGIGGNAPDDVIVANYTFKSTNGGCGLPFETTDFTLDLRVPIEREPGIAQALISREGLVLPPLDLIFPYKYKDKVVLKIKALSLFNQFKGSAGATGTWKMIQGSIDASIEKAKKELIFAGDIAMDCQNPDETVCMLFVQKALEILSQEIVKITAINPSTEPNLSPIAAKAGGQASGAMFRIDLAMDQASAEVRDDFEVNFSNTKYSSIHSQAQLSIVKIPAEVLDPEVASKLKGKL